MVWSWSHSAEGLDNARQNLELMPKSELEIIFAEWRAAQLKHGHVDSNAWSQKKYDRALAYAKGLCHDVLVDFIWEKASEASNCENGGFHAWMCPSGCMPHLVSFSPPDEEEEEDS